MSYIVAICYLQALVAFFDDMFLRELASMRPQSNVDIEA